MKKLFTIILAALLLTGCSQTNDTPDTKPTAGETTDNEPETAASESDSIAETVLVDEAGIKITAKSRARAIACMGVTTTIHMIPVE